MKNKKQPIKMPRSIEDFQLRPKINKNRQKDNQAQNKKSITYTPTKDNADNKIVPN